MYTLLFFDDWHLHNRINLERQIGKPKLIPESIFRDPIADSSWGYPTVIKKRIYGDVIIKEKQMIVVTMYL